MAGAPTEGYDLTGIMVTDAVPVADWLVIAPVALAMAWGALMLMIRKDVARQNAVALLGLALLLAIDVALLAHVVERGTVTMTMGRWLPPFGIAFTVDALGALFALGAGIAAMAAGVFATADLGDGGGGRRGDGVEGREMRYGFWPFVFLMVGGVHGAFLTGDVFNLYVWFEVLLIASFGLIILGSEAEQIDGATKYTFLNLAATTFFLIGTAFLYGATGTLNMADLALKVPLMGATAPMLTIGALYAFAFAMKAAAFPVNFWLPASYHTPRIVVSALFAGLLTKVGVYALLRIMLLIMPEARDAIAPVIAWVAIGTMVTGALGALAQTDLRRLLGYLVISGIGVMLAGLAIATEAALAGTVFYAIHSIVVMTALYMAIGAAGGLGGYSLAVPAGLYRCAGLLAFLTLMLFFTVAGLPPLTGFWPKAILVRESLDIGANWLAAAILLNGFVVTIAVGRAFALHYWRPAREPGSEAGPPPLAAPALAPTDGGVSAEGEAAEAEAAAAEAASGPPDPFELAHARAVSRALARPSAPPRRAMAPLAVLCGLILAVGLYPEPLLALAAEAGRGLLDPAAYLLSVFPDGLPVPLAPLDAPLDAPVEAAVEAAVDTPAGIVPAEPVSAGERPR